jgi:hypothetical protein
MTAHSVTIVVSEETTAAFNRWWHDEGSGLPPLGEEDQSEHVRRVCEIAWANGAYSEASRILRLMKEQQ